MKSFTKWISTAAFLVAALVGGQAQAATYYSEGDSGTVDGSKGQSLILTLVGGDGLRSFVSLFGNVALKGTYTISLFKDGANAIGQRGEAGDEIYATYSNGKVVAGKGNFALYSKEDLANKKPAYANSVTTFTDEDAGLDAFFLAAASIGSVKYDEVFTITPDAKSSISFYVAALSSKSASVAVVPEPETYALMAVGLLGLGLARRRKSQGNTLVAA